MTFYYFNNSLDGINLGIEFSSACLLLLLLVAIIMKNTITKEIEKYKGFIFFNVLAVWTDVAAYVVTGNKQLVYVLLFLCVASYITTGCAAYYFYLYLYSHYEDRYNYADEHNTQKVMLWYVLSISIIYITSLWTGWFYRINSEYMYELGKYAMVTGLLYLPILFECLMIALKNRKAATKRESIIHIMFIIIYVVLAYVDSVFMTSVHFLAAVIFAYLIYIVISMEQEQELSIKETELVKSELNALRLQMNPHYVYNTLASIDGLCAFDPKAARDLITKFTKHLRNSYLDNSPSTIPFEKELENLKSYFAVEQVRFPNINFVTDIKVKDFEVPPLTVQPIFENAIKHGICGRDDAEGTITLSTYEKDGCYHIVIKDDGIGFDTNIKKEYDGRTHLGVENTRKRLELICNGSIITVSKVGVGTTVDMIIPGKEK